MPGLSVVILSKNLANLTACVRAVRTCEPRVQIIVADDGIDWAQAPADVRNGCLIVDGAKPFVFARNANVGIRTADRDDVVLLNDDALLESEGGFELLRSAAAANREIGVLAATTNVTGYPAQRRMAASGRLWRPTPVAAFVAVLLPRRTLDQVGWLDERFVTYGGEDVDYCRRVRRAGMTVGVCDGCYVDHGSLQSTFRPGNGAGDIAEGVRLLGAKWGDECRFR